MEAWAADTAAILTAPVPHAVVGAPLNAAVLAAVVREAHTLPVHTAALVVAVVGAGQLAAAGPRVALVADAPAVHAPPVVVAVVGVAGGGGAVGALPARVAHAGAGDGLVGAVAAAAGVHAWGRDRPDNGTFFWGHAYSETIFSSRITSDS